MAPLSGEWLEALKGEFHQPYYAKLYKTVMQEYQTHKIFPPADDMFNAFHFTPLSQVKVVILGQDPYHNDGQAHGLCFSVKRDVEIPPSLVNIYQELHDDLGCYIPDNGYLEKWARQGVLMLNTVLTVRAHQANSHRGIGWEQFTDAAIGILNEQDRPIVFLLWGRPAQMKKSMLNNPKHLILEAPHPSPLSAYRGFFGCKHFSKANEFLKEHGIRTRVRAKISDGSDEIIESIRHGYVSYVINTRDINDMQNSDGWEIRQCAVENNVTMFTALDTVRVLLDVLEETTLCISTIDA